MLLNQEFFPGTAVDGSPLTWKAFRKPRKKSVRETIKTQQVNVEISEASKKAEVWFLELQWNIHSKLVTLA